MAFWVAGAAQRAAQFYHVQVGGEDILTAEQLLKDVMGSFCRGSFRD
jgi:hypothetical protein